LSKGAAGVSWDSGTHVTGAGGSSREKAGLSSRGSNSVSKIV
jgi:hypothetical protein